MLIVADADEVDVPLPVDLSAGEKEHVDAALAGAIEQFASAVGEEGVRPAAEQRYVRPSMAERARQERRRRRDRRGIADRHMPGVADQPGDDGGQKLFVAKSSLRRRGVHARTDPNI